MFVLTTGELASRLQEASVKIINRNTCNKLYDDAVTPRMLCAGNLQGGVDACQVSVHITMNIILINAHSQTCVMMCCNLFFNIATKCTAGLKDMQSSKPQKNM